MTKAPVVLKTLKPTGKWLADADLRHDAAIVLGCYLQGGGAPRNVNFLTHDLREKQKQLGGELVVDPVLTTQLYEAYLNHFIRNSKYPESVYHIDYPGSIFAVRIYASRRKMGHERLISDIKQAFLPGPVKFILFFRVAKSISVGNNPLKN